MQQPKETLAISPKVLEWARVRAGFSLDEALLYFPNLAAWEEGLAMPTYRQLEKLAERFKCPVAVFFFPEPPDLPNASSSFRTLTAADFDSIPRGVRTLLRRGQAMQLNLAELNDGKNPAKRLITRDLKVSPRASIETIAAEVRRFLGVALEEQIGWETAEKALEAWRDAFADVGVYVFKDAFKTSSYFGFCLYDEQFPIVYVNNTSAKSRQIFTLFHELGHLIFHTSGVDKADEAYVEQLQGDKQRIEQVCNQLAAYLLVPNDVFDAMIKGRTANRGLAAELADHFLVSREVIYRKLLDRNEIDGLEYAAAVKQWNDQMKKAEAKGGGNYYNNQHAYLGTRYIDLAFRRYYQRRFDNVQLAEYLNVKPKALPTFEERFGGGGLWST